MSSLPFGDDFEFSIPPDDLAASQDALKTLEDKFLVHLKDLNGPQRRVLTKMGSRSVDFVDKTLGYTKANLQMKPGFVDIDRALSNVDAYGLLRTFMQAFDRLRDMSSDTMVIVGAQANGAALACYNGFQYAAKMNQPGAALIVADLAPRFAGQGRVDKPQDPPPAPAPKSGE